MAGMGPKYKNDAVFIQGHIKCAFNTKSDGLPETGNHGRMAKGCLQLFTMEALGKNNVDSSDT